MYGPVIAQIMWSRVFRDTERERENFSIFILLKTADRREALDVISSHDVLQLRSILFLSPIKSLPLCRCFLTDALFFI